MNPKKIIYTILILTSTACVQNKKVKFLAGQNGEIILIAEDGKSKDTLISNSKFIKGKSGAWGITNDNGKTVDVLPSFDEKSLENYPELIWKKEDEDEWNIIIGATTDDKEEWSINKDYVSKDSSEITFWVKSQQTSKKESKTGWTLLLCTIDCSKKKYKFAKEIHYSADGNLVSEESVEQSWEFIIPESVISSIFTESCKNFN